MRYVLHRVRYHTTRMLAHIPRPRPPDYLALYCRAIRRILEIDKHLIPFMREQQRLQEEMAWREQSRAALAKIYGLEPTPPPPNPPSNNSANPVPNPVHPVNPVNPVPNPVHPVNPVNPVNPVPNPVHPVNPVPNPLHPVHPVNPVPNPVHPV